MNSTRNTPSGKQIKIQWACITNGYEGDHFQAVLRISNLSQTDLAANGWALYFNTCRKIKPETVTGGVVVEHVNGDLFRLLPAADFGGLAAGATLEIHFVGALWVISETDAPLGFYIVYRHGTPEAYAEAIGDPDIAPFVSNDQRHRNKLDQLPLMTAERRFDDNASLSMLPAAEVGRITPTPLESQFTNGEFHICAATPIIHSPQLAREAAFLQTALRDVSGLLLDLTSHGTGITLQLGAVAVPDSGTPDEAYLLEITTNGIVITGASAHGVANGIQSLRQLLPIEAFRQSMERLAVPCGRVLDAPRFAYRGMMLDVARYFSSKETVLRFLDCMALYKLNKFHFHVTDDEGWRVEIRTLPELTQFGSQRGFSTDGRADETTCLCPSFGSGADVNNSSSSGFYSRADFIEILRFAADRHIEVVPEFNIPGHSRAAIKSMEFRYRRLMDEGNPTAAAEYLLTDFDDASVYESVQLWHDNVVCIAKDSCYRFIETVLDEVQSMYAEASAPLTTIHTGGDEVPHGAWGGSPICKAFMQAHEMQTIGQLQDHFLARYRDILSARGLIFGGWEEIALSKQTDGATTKLAPNPKFIDANFQPYVWNNTWGAGQEDFAYQLANAGYKVILSNVTNLYFDLAYAKDPQEPGYYWGGFIETRDAFEFCPFDIYTTATVNLFGNPLDATTLGQMQRLTAQGIANVRGIQGQLWGENSRTKERVEYLALPRILALAERAWTQDPRWTKIDDRNIRTARMDADWNQFANRLGQRELARLDGLNGGYHYRIPLPGLKLINGCLHANISTPGLTLRYTLHGGEPNANSNEYVAPLIVGSGKLKIAAFSSTGRKSRTVTQTDIRTDTV